MNLEEYQKFIETPENIISTDDTAILSYKDSNVYILNSFFKPKIYNLIQNDIQQLVDNLDSNIDYHEDDNRIAASLSSSMYLNELRIIFQEDEIVRKRYLDFFEKSFQWPISKLGLENIDFSLWIDNTEYNIPLHYDTDVIKYSIQIYLSEYRHGIGTSLSYSDSTKDTFVNIGFVQNGGYAMKNSHDFYHGMEQKVPDGYKRISLYFRIN
jgi:hypothetical protein